MRDSDADIAIDVLNKLIDQELKAASAGMRDGNRILEECASTRYHAYTFARDEIGKALADAVEERDAENPFLPQRDELVTRICIRAICVAGGARVPCTACACATRTSPGWRPKCAPTACGGLDSGRSGRCRSRRIGGMSAGCRSIRLRGGAPMIYLIVDGELVDILTEMDEALAKAMQALAEHAGKVEIADLVTGRRTIIKQARKGNRR